MNNIPIELREKYESIASMITLFCDKHLDDDYKDLCLHALQKLSRKRAMPLSKGRDNMWAAGIVYAIAQNNNLVGNRPDFFLGIPKYHLVADEVSDAFGVSKGGMSEKAKSIREALHIYRDREEWLIPEIRENECRMMMLKMKRRTNEKFQYNGCVHSFKTLYGRSLRKSGRDKKAC